MPSLLTLRFLGYLLHARSRTHDTLYLNSKARYMTSIHHPQSLWDCLQKDPHRDQGSVRESSSLKETA